MREGTKNRLKKKLGRAAEKIPGNRLGYRMFLVYIFGGFLPLVLIGLPDTGNKTDIGKSGQKRRSPGTFYGEKPDCRNAGYHNHHVQIFLL